VAGACLRVADLPTRHAEPRIRELRHARHVRDTFEGWAGRVARVSTRDQHPEAQTDAAAGCEKTVTCQASGTLARRPALDEALSNPRAGDTLVVTKLDRLGRSVRNIKQVADDLQARQVGLRAVSQSIDTTTPGGRLVFPDARRRGPRAAPAGTRAITERHPTPGRPSGLLGEQCLVSR